MMSSGILAFLLLLPAIPNPYETTQAQTPPTVTYDLRSSDFDSAQSAQLLVTIDESGFGGVTAIAFGPNPSFNVSPDPLSVKSGAGKTINSVCVNRIGDPPSGQYKILARAAFTPNTGSSIEIDQIIAFDYVRRISISRYLVLGLAGFLIGYALRLVTGVLGKITPPAPVIAESDGQQSESPITAFVKAHYYWVDLCVSATLTFLVLLYLLKDGHPPDQANTWYGALLVGTGLGFLTNNDLLNKFKP